jgi:hypothetical protein
MNHPGRLNSGSRLQRSAGSRNFNGFNDGDFDADDGFRRVNIIFIDSFASPFFPFFGFPFFGSPFFGFSFFDYPFYGPYPYYSPYLYPYSPYGYYGYEGGYGVGYQGSYGVNGSVVVQVQRRLASDGLYSGRIDGVVGSRTRRAIRAYERSHGLRVDGQIHRSLLRTMGLA